MKVLIVGIGETGFYIASEFAEGNFEVTVIDEDPEQLKKISRSLNVAGILGSGASLPTLEKAGVKSADLLIAATDHDETNLICCLLANHYKVKHTIAVTKTESYMKRKVVLNYLNSGISQIINSTMLTVQEIIDTATLPTAAEVSAFGKKDVLLIGYRVKKDSPWKDLYLKDIRPPNKENQFLIACIVRDGRSSIPTGQDQVQEGDYVYILIPRQTANSLNKLLNVKGFSNRKAVVAGENLVAEQVARRLLKSHYKVTMICSDESKVVEMRKKFSGRRQFEALQGEINLLKTQLKAEVGTSSLFIAVSRNDHSNIFAGMAARYLGATKIICLVNSQDIVQCAQGIDIDVVISPRLSAARLVKKLIRGGETRLNYTTISETNMEVIEIIASSNSDILGIPLRKLEMPTDTLAGAIIKGKKVIIPTGETTIEARDKVIMVGLPESLPKIQELLEGKKA